MNNIPKEWRERVPLITPEAWAGLIEVQEDQDAPIWNWPIGDRILETDLGALNEHRSKLATKRERRVSPSNELKRSLEKVRPNVEAMQSRLKGKNLESVDWNEIPPMARQNLIQDLAAHVPRGIEMDRLITFGTSGSTGHSLELPHHPASVATHFISLEYVLNQYGINPIFKPGKIACVNVGAQAESVAVFCTSISVWNGAVFCKVTLHRDYWKPEAARKFFKTHEPMILTGDPGGFLELLEWDIDFNPLAVVSSASKPDEQLRQDMENKYSCPFIDSYATTETGPIAFDHPDGCGMAILPPDLHIEVIDETGLPLNFGEVGEICVSTTHNPYLPLLRYRTGDRGRLIDPHKNGNLRLVDLQARGQYGFRDENGAPVSTVDLSRLIHQYPVHCYQCRGNDKRVSFKIRPKQNVILDLEALKNDLHELLGSSIVQNVEVDAKLGTETKFEMFIIEEY